MSAAASVERIETPGERTPGTRSAVRRAVLALALMAVFALAAVLTRLPELDRYATIDESRWVGRSADLLIYIERRDWDKTFLVGHPGVTTMWLGALGMGPSRVRAMSQVTEATDPTRRDGYLEALVAARRGALVANAVALGVLVGIGWALFGPGAAVLGGLLMLADPFLTAHSRLIHLDALLSSFLCVSALASIAFWSGRGYGYLVLAGIAGGLALLTKAPSMYLLGFVPVLAVIAVLRGRRRVDGAFWLRLTGDLLLWGALASATALTLWPALRARPLAVVRQMLDFAIRNGSSEGDNFFLGQPVADPGLSFYPLALVFRLTPLAILGLVLLGALLWRGPRPRSAWNVLMVAACAAGFIVMMQVGQKKFDRYILPVFPLLSLLAGLGLWLGFQALQRRFRARVPYARWLLAGGAVVLAIWPAASVFPYYLAYYNPLLGGGAAAQWALFVGWGEGLDRVAAYINAKPLTLASPLVATDYHRVLQAHLRGNNAMPVERAELADYIVPYVNAIQREQHGGALADLVRGQTPEHVVWINGIEYARVYRGPHHWAERAMGAEWAGRAALDSVVYAPGSGILRAGQELQYRQRWRSAAPDGLIVVTRIIGSDGQVVLQDRSPLNRALREGELLLVDTTLRLPTALVPGAYRVQVIVDDSASGKVLAVAGGEEAVLLLQLQVLPPAAP